MSLLETKNKKFNLPFVFIAGAIFLVGLAYFAHYLESFEENALNLELPKAQKDEVNAVSIYVRLTKEGIVYLDSMPLKAIEIKEKLKLKLDGQANPTIILQLAEDVPVQKAVNIMEFANENHYKVILKIRSQ